MLHYLSLRLLRLPLANKGHDTRALLAYLGHRNIQHTVRYTDCRQHVFGISGESEKPAVN